MVLKLALEMRTSAKVNAIIGTKHGTIQKSTQLSTLNSLQQLAQNSTKNNEKSLVNFYAKKTLKCGAKLATNGFLCYSASTIFYFKEE